MSKRCHSNRKRRAQLRRNRFRFARLESLESRILLDGSGSLFDPSGALGNNLADVHTVINIAEGTYMMSISDGSEDAPAPIEVARPGTIRLAVDWDRDVVFGSIAGDVLDEVVLSELFEFRLHGLRPSSNFVTSGNSVGDFGIEQTLADPARIEMSAPIGGSLLTPGIASDTAHSNQPVNQPDGPKAAAARSELAFVRQSEPEQPSDSVRPASSSDAAPTQAALSSDQYFASYSRRTSVAFSTHSAAAECRQHVVAKPHHVARDHHASDSATLVSLAWQTAAGTTTGSAWKGASGMNRSNRIATTSCSAESAPAEHLRPAPAASADVGVAPASSLDNDPRGNVVSGGCRRVRDLALSLYEPASLLVGVSLVSAHLSADSHATKKKRFRALRRR
jgi:hypothetical protein